MKKTILLPWTKHISADGNTLYRRYILGFSASYYQINTYNMGIWALSWDDKDGYFSAQKAMKAFDANMSDRGFTLLTDEQWEKMMVLL